MSSKHARTMAVVAAIAASAVAAPAASAASSLALAHARQQVRAAQHESHAAVSRLVARVRARRAHAADALSGPTPSQQALAVALYDAGSASEDATQSNLPVPSFTADVARAPIAKAAGCWGPARDTWRHTIAGGANVVSLTETNPSWCGNGSSITFGHDNWDHKPWSQYPYCLTNVSNHQGWDHYASWAHGGIWGTTGIYTIAFVCAPILGSEHATVRVAANGYHDGYDDFGF